MPAADPHQTDLDARRDAMLARLRDRIERTKHHTEVRQREVQTSRIRMRTLLLPAFAIVLFIHFGSRAGGPLGVEAAFTPGPGTSFAGPRVFELPAGAPPATPVRLEPGDVVGARSGETSVLEVGEGRMRLEAGARAVLASLLPPRVRLLGGSAEASGRIRVVTANGIIDLSEGRVRLVLDEEGLAVTLLEGAGSIVAPDATEDLVVGRRIVAR